MYIQYQIQGIMQWNTITNVIDNYYNCINKEFHTALASIQFFSGK